MLWDTGGSKSPKRRLSAVRGMKSRNRSDNGQRFPASYRLTPILERTASRVSRDNFVEEIEQKLQVARMRGHITMMCCTGWTTSEFDQSQARHL